MDKRRIEYYRVKYTLFVVLFASFLAAKEAFSLETSRSHWIKLGAYLLVIAISFALPKRLLLGGVFFAVVSFRAIFGYLNTRNPWSLAFVLGGAIVSVVLLALSAKREKPLDVPGSGYSVMELCIDVTVLLLLLWVGIQLT